MSRNFFLFIWVRIYNLLQIIIRLKQFEKNEKQEGTIIHRYQAHVQLTFSQVCSELFNWSSCAELFKCSKNLNRNTYMLTAKARRAGEWEPIFNVYVHHTLLFGSYGYKFTLYHTNGAPFLASWLEFFFPLNFLLSFFSVLGANLLCSLS